MSRRVLETSAAAASIVACLVFTGVLLVQGFHVSIRPMELRSKEPAAYVASTRAFIDQGVGDAAVKLPLRRADLSLPDVIAVLDTPAYANVVARRAAIDPGDLQFEVARKSAASSGEPPSSENDAVLLSLTPLSLQPTFSVGARAGRPGVARRSVIAVTDVLRHLVTSGGVFPQDPARPVALWAPAPAQEVRVPSSGPGTSAFVQAFIAAAIAFRVVRKRMRVRVAKTDRLQTQVAGAV